MAKELKDAGFPQDLEDGVLLHTPECTRDPSPLCTRALQAYSPTLEELIEACVPHFGYVGHYMEGGQPTPDIAWKAFGSGSTFYAPTPAEAVARLWLALNRDKMMK